MLSPATPSSSFSHIAHFMRSAAILFSHFDRTSLVMSPKRSGDHHLFSSNPGARLEESISCIDNIKCLPCEFVAEDDDDYGGSWLCYICMYVFRTHISYAKRLRHTARHITTSATTKKVSLHENIYTQVDFGRLVKRCLFFFRILYCCCRLEVALTSC